MAPGVVISNERLPVPIPESTFVVAGSMVLTVDFLLNEVLRLWSRPVTLL